MKLSTIVRQAQKIVSDNSPAVLTGMAVSGTVLTGYLTYKGTLKAVETLDSEAINQHVDVTLFKTSDKLKLTWRHYAPAVGTAAATCTCMVMATRISTSRTAAMVAAFTISERAYDQYKDKVVEQLGENKHVKVRDAVAQDQVSAAPGGSLVVVGDGDVLCFDRWSGRYFQSNMEALNKAANRINHEIIHGTYASLSQFYDEIGLEHITTSDELGWDSNNLLELEFSTVLYKEKTPCIAIGFNVVPSRGYDRLHG